MKWVISQEVLDVTYENGSLVKIRGNGNTAKTLRAYSKSGKHLNIKLGSIVGYTVEFKNGTTTLTIDKLYNDEVYTVVVDEVDVDIGTALSVFKMDYVLDQVNQLC